MASAQQTQAEDKANTRVQTDNTSVNSKASPGTKKKAKTKKKKATNKRRSQTRAASTQKKRRKETFPSVSLTIEICHRSVENLFEKFYDRFRQCYFHVTSSMQKARLDEGLDLVLAYLEEQIDGSTQTLTSNKEDLRRRIGESLGDDKIQINNPVKRKINALVPAGVVRKYLSLFTALDEYMDMVIYAETMGVITHTQKRKLIKNCPRYVSSIAGRFQGLSAKIDIRAHATTESLKKCVAAVVAEAQGHRPIHEARPLGLTSTQQSSQQTATQAEVAEAWA